MKFEHSLSNWLNSPRKDNTYRTVLTRAGKQEMGSQEGASSSQTYIPWGASGGAGLGEAM